MIKIIIGTLILSMSLVSFAQKPKKTFDEKKFMKQVQFSFTPELINKSMPDDNALQYIAENSEKSLEELQSSNSENLERIKNSVTEINALGLVYVWDNIEVKIIQESPIKIADLLIHCHAKEKTFIIKLTNCVQTNISWYLGDGIVPEGDGFEETIAIKESKKDSKPGGLLGKMNELNQGVEEMEDKANIALLEQKIIRDSLNDLRPGYETNYSSFLYNEAKDNIPMHGYYILNDGTKVNAVILNQAPEFFVGDKADKFKLALCQSASNSPLIGFNNQDPNFEKYLYKKDIKAFYVNGYLYKKVGFYGWVIALDEGAIHNYITIVKLNFNNKDSYQIFKQTQKLDGSAYGSPLMPISEEKLLAMMEDAPEIVQGYKNGKYNLESAEIEYNIWYDKQNPNKVDYLFGPEGKQ